LSTDARLGLFVVAKLSQRQGISVRLAESDYGGVKAIVLIPNTLVVAESERRSGEGYSPAEDFQARPALAPGPVTMSAMVAEPPANSVPGAGEKPALPRRQRAVGEAEAEPVAEKIRPVRAPRPRSADEARNLMSAIESGTRQGRHHRVNTDTPTTQSDRQEGAGDNSQAP